MMLWARSRSSATGDDGSVTAEFAVTLPAVILVLVCCVSGLQIAGQQLRLQDAAAAAARSMARGDSAPATTARLMPGATSAEFSDGDLDCVTLTIPSAAVVGSLLGFTLAASSCALGGGR